MGMRDPEPGCPVDHETIERLQRKVSRQRSINNRNIDVMVREIDRLRALLDDAPHEKSCAALIPMYFHALWPCDCWKAKIHDPA